MLENPCISANAMKPRKQLMLNEFVCTSSVAVVFLDEYDRYVRCIMIYPIMKSASS